MKCKKFGYYHNLCDNYDQIIKNECNRQKRVKYANLYIICMIDIIKHLRKCQICDETQYSVYRLERTVLNKLLEFYYSEPEFKKKSIEYLYKCFGKKTCNGNTKKNKKCKKYILNTDNNDIYYCKFHEHQYEQNRYSQFTNNIDKYLIPNIQKICYQYYNDQLSYVDYDKYKIKCFNCNINHINNYDCYYKKCIFINQLYKKIIYNIDNNNIDSIKNLISNCKLHKIKNLNINLLLRNITNNDIYSYLYSNRNEFYI